MLPGEHNYCNSSCPEKKKFSLFKIRQIYFCLDIIALQSCFQRVFSPMYIRNRALHAYSMRCVYFSPKTILFPPLLKMKFFPLSRHVIFYSYCDLIEFIIPNFSFIYPFTSPFSFSFPFFLFISPFFLFL
jgi:hypothetical protein